MALTVTLKKLLIGRAFTTERGRIRTFGKMDWTLEPSAGMAQLIQLPAEEVQKKFKENVEDFLFNFGYNNGIIITEEISRSIGTTNKEVTQKTINDLLEFIGVGQLEFIVSKIEKDGHHHVVIRTMNNPIIEAAKEMYGNKSMVCAFFRGMFSAYGEKQMNMKNVKLEEKTCMCKTKGIGYCEWDSKW